jgi:hypothetical protein
MTHWLSAEDICSQYAVKLSTLITYSNRGNLGRQITPRGKALFNARQVANLFPPRSQDANNPKPMSLGTLGQAMLGRSRTRTIVKDYPVQVSRIGRRNHSASQPVSTHQGPVTVKKTA